MRPALFSRGGGCAPLTGIASLQLRWIWPPADYSDALWASQLLGTTTVSTRVTSRSLSWGARGAALPSSGSNTGPQYNARSLMLPDEILTMQGLLVLENKRRPISAEPASPPALLRL
jgi:type IV secretory pathway TraG/TraD family ATPase VirD4